MSCISDRFFTPNEVAEHNSANDIWVTFLGKVYNLTSLCSEYCGDPLIKPIIKAAGTDISHWFNPQTRDMRIHVDPETGIVRPYCPQGLLLHVPPPLPDTCWANDFGEPWWRREDDYAIGCLSSKTQVINIVNTLTSQEQLVEVCTEENMYAILRRYLKYNKHARSYTWKYDCRVLEMNKTLMENGIADDDEEFHRLSIDDHVFLQTIHLYFNDDLTEA